jgi:hypothetical protein
MTKWTTPTYTIVDSATNPLFKIKYWKLTDSSQLTMYVKEVYGFNIAHIDLDTQTITIHGALQGGGHKDKVTPRNKTKQTQITTFTSSNINPHTLQCNNITSPHHITNFTVPMNMGLQDQFNITYIDSLGQPNRSITTKISQWIKLSYPNACITQSHSYIAQQRNNDDCGPWAIMNAHMFISACMAGLDPTLYIKEQPIPISITTLRKQMYELAYKYWKTPHDPHPDIGDTPVTKDDLLRCPNNNWYNDNLVNLGLAHWLPNCNKMTTLKNVAYFPTIIDRLRPRPILSKYLILPINVNANHWILCAITHHNHQNAALAPMPDTSLNPTSNLTNYQPPAPTILSPTLTFSKLVTLRTTFFI